jgi:homoserine O-acetyltransferase/O-succinyltransferase
MTYLSDAALESKFGRRRRGGTRQFEVDSYLEYQASKFAVAYDANSYLRVQTAMDELDLEEKFGSLTAAFQAFRAPTLLVSFDTDWLFPTAEMQRIHVAMRETQITATHIEISTPNGHECPAGNRMAADLLEITSESTSSDMLPVSTRVQAFHGVTEK